MYYRVDFVLLDGTRKSWGPLLGEEYAGRVASEFRRCCDVKEVTMSEENKINDGGPAFPSTETQRGNTAYCEHGEGMTLRDYFAAQALSGIVQFADLPTRLRPVEMAEGAYNIADAMIKWRKGGAA